MLRVFAWARAFLRLKPVSRKTIVSAKDALAGFSVARTFKFRKSPRVAGEFAAARFKIAALEFFPAVCAL